jgi:diadenosine tetraphosphate (Ap4A) HIT family hydrolase
MAYIYETTNFLVESFETPHVTRTDGGHIKILPKVPLKNRTEMSPALAIEFIRLTMIIGEAFEKAMEKRGIKLMRLNYQDMGNWAFKYGKEPYFHMHIYGRAENAKYHPYQESVYLPDRSTGFYKNFEPLNEDDIKEIQKQISIIEKKEKYNGENWKLSF